MNGTTLPFGSAVSEPPLVSVIIVNWNTCELLAQALESLFAQVDQPSYDVTVIDNASSDGSADMVRRRWPEVHLVALPHNVGFAAGNNIGFTESRGAYILLLNSDTVVLPTTVRGLASILDRDASIGCVGARHMNGDGSLQRSMNEFPTLHNDFLELTELSRLRVVQTFLRRRFPWWSAHDTTCDTGWVNGACMMIRRAVCDNVGVLDEQFFAYFEEVEWCYRMQLAGWRVVFTPEAEVIHLSGQSLDGDPGRRLHLRFWGHCAFYRTHYSLSRYLALRAIIVGTSAMRIGALSLLWLLGRFHFSPSQPLWEIVAQDTARASYPDLIGAWGRILCGVPVQRPDLVHEAAN